MINQESIISKSLLAGVCISVGGYLFLSCITSIIGPALFSAGFLCCTLLGLNLFTDKSGFLSDSQDMRRLVLVLLLNMFAAFMCGLIVRFSDTSVAVAADKIITEQIDTDYASCIIKSIITGFLLTLAVESENKQCSGHIITLLCVVSFSITGCLHCVADSFYFGASTMTYDGIGNFILKLLIVIFFNFIGCNLYNLFVNKSFIHNS